MPDEDNPFRAPAAPVDDQTFVVVPTTTVNNGASADIPMPKSMEVKAKADAAKNVEKKELHPGRMTSFLSTDPDKAHDKKVSGLQIDPAVAEMKLSLRKLRDAIGAVHKVYAAYSQVATQWPSDKKCRLALALPELADWAGHDAWCGAEPTGTAMHRDASQLAAVAGAARALRKEIGGRVVNGLLGAKKRVAEDGIQTLLALELQILATTSAREAATKALKRARAAKEAADDEAVKAQFTKDQEGSKPAVLIRAAKSKEVAAKAEAELREAEGALAAAVEELRRLGEEATPAALNDAQKARQHAEAVELPAALEALRAANREFCQYAHAVLAGKRRVFQYQPKVRGRAPKPKGDRFATATVQWTLAQQRCEKTTKRMSEYSKHGLATMLAPKSELDKLSALADVCTSAELISQLRAAPLPKDQHEAARAACGRALGELTTHLEMFVKAMKRNREMLVEFQKISKTLTSAEHKLEDADKEMQRLADNQKPAEKKQAARLVLQESVAAERAKLEQTAAAIETLVAELRNGGAPHAATASATLEEVDMGGSVARAVGEPLSDFVTQYIAFCTTRYPEASPDAPNADEAACTPPEEPLAAPLSSPTTDGAPASFDAPGSASTILDSAPNPFGDVAEVSSNPFDAERDAANPFADAESSPLPEGVPNPFDADGGLEDGGSETDSEAEETGSEPEPESELELEPKPAAGPEVEREATVEVAGVGVGAGAVVAVVPPSDADTQVGMPGTAGTAAPHVDRL